MRECFASEQRDCKYAGNPADELCDDIKYGVPILHLSKTPEGESDRGIEVRARSFAQRGKNQRDGSPTHRHPGERPANEFVWNDCWNGRIRVPKQNGEKAGRNHEEPKLGGFAK